jgi:hypothetical protein
MTDFRNLTKETLDSAFSEFHVYVSFGKRKVIENDFNSEEYIVFTQSDNTPEEKSCEDEIRNTQIIVRYYIIDSLLEKKNGRDLLFNRTNLIISAMQGVGFICSNGVSDVGDIDDVGFATFVMMFNYSEVV